MTFSFKSLNKTGALDLNWLSASYNLKRTLKAVILHEA